MEYDILLERLTLKEKVQESWNSKINAACCHVADNFSEPLKTQFRGE